MLVTLFSKEEVDRTMRIERAGRERLFSVGEKILIFILLLSFLDFQLYGMHFMIIAFVVYCFLNGRLCITNGVVPPMILSVSLLLFWELAFSDSTTIVKCFVWPTAFLLGYGMTIPASYDPKSVEKTERKAGILIVVAVFGLFSHYALNMLINLEQQDLGRNTIDIWSGESRAATGQAALACIPMGWCIAAIVKKSTLKRKVPAIITLLVILYYNLTLSTRLLIIMLPILVAVALIYLLANGTRDKKKTHTLLTIIFIGIVFLFAYSLNLWGFQDTIDNSLLSERFSGNEGMQIDEDSRWLTKLEYIKRMPQHLWGGSHIFATTGNYAHDVLLDTYDEAGLFALAAVIAILWDAVSKLRHLLKSTHVKFDTKVTVLCIYVAIFMEFMVEPIIAGMPWLLMDFCLFHGIVTGLVKNTQCLVNNK